MKRHASGKLSAFEVAINKGDARLLKDLPVKLTLEDAVTGLFALWQYLDCPDFRELHWIYTWWDHDFDRKSTAAKLNLKLKALNKRIERLEKLYRLSGCLLRLKDAINGLFTLWGRLNCNSLKRLHWVHTWWDKDFSREETALKLKIDIEILHKRIERLEADYKSSEPNLPRGACIPDNIRDIEKESTDENEEI